MPVYRVNNAGELQQVVFPTRWQRIKQRLRKLKARA